jgi:hypothetical protein
MKKPILDQRQREAVLLNTTSGAFLKLKIAGLKLFKIIFNASKN